MPVVIESMGGIYPRFFQKLLCLVLLTLLGMGVWVGRSLVPGLEPRAELFMAPPLQLPPALAGVGPVRVVHFWDPHCPCNVANQLHLATLLERFEPQVAFYSVQRPGRQGQLPPLLAGLSALAALEGMEGLPASPAVAIWNQQGELVYVGPYHDGSRCSEGQGLVVPMLEALLDHRPVQATQQLAVACFCDWH